MEFKITYRCDQEEYFCTDNYIIEADSFLEAAQKADDALEEPSKATILAVERINY